MTTQPEALRLADQLRDMSTKFKTPSHERGVCNGAIQELRRLHAVNTELLEALKELAAQLRRLHAVNTELLEALKELAAQTDSNFFAIKHDHVALQNARAAITKATGERA